MSVLLDNIKPQCIPSSERHNIATCLEELFLRLVDTKNWELIVKVEIILKELRQLEDKELLTI